VHNESLTKKKPKTCLAKGGTTCDQSRARTNKGLRAMASYLVTGGCGFIGSHLADALVARGHRVRVLDDLSSGKRTNAPAKADIVVGDVADPTVVRRAMERMDGCFHLAAIASVQRSVEA